jgi:hypothetical protein
LDKDAIPVKELRDTLNDARGVDTEERLARNAIPTPQHAHLTLKVLHYIQEAIVNLWLVLKLILDRVKVAERIGDVQRTSGLR